MTLSAFRYDLQIASKCGCLSEPEGRVGTGAFTNQACAANRNRSESYYSGCLYPGQNPLYMFCNK